MSINSNIRVTHSETDIQFKLTSSRTAVESGFSISTATIGSIEETISFGDILTPRQVLLRLMSGDDVQVGVATGVYPLRLSGTDDYMSLRLDVEGLVETATVTTAADSSDSLDGTYFVVEDSNSETWAIGTGTLSHGEDNEVATGLLTDNTAAEVAAAYYAALVADAAFSALFDVAYDAATDDDLLTITDKHVGSRTNIADTGSTGFTLSTTQNGGAAPTVYLKSGGTSTIVIAVAPN